MASEFRSRIGLASFVFGATFLALIPAIGMWGFTVDDALIPARYAHHLASGHGYRFSANGPMTDGVTPLPWTFLLVPFAFDGVLSAWFAAKVIGLCAWMVTAGLVAREVVLVGGKPGRIAGLWLLASSAPLAAWSVAGLSTGAVTLLATAGVLLRLRGRDYWGVLLAGSAAAFRPELLPWVLMLGLAPPHREPKESGRWRGVQRADLLRLSLSGAPFVATALARATLFGSPAPLSVFAKAPSVDLGMKYAFACLLLTGPVALLAPLCWRRVSGFVQWLLVGVVVHFAAVALAGGDWMPLSRLVVPVLPTVALVAAHLGRFASLGVTLLRTSVAVAAQIFAAVSVGPAAARVGEARTALIDELSPHLESSDVVAVVDAGWVGAACDATIVDLAGVTDPKIAALPGGHTTKRIPSLLLDDRHVDTLILLLGRGERLAEPWTDSHFARGVEVWLATQPGIESEFHPVAVSRQRKLPYVVLRRDGPVTSAPKLPSLED